MSFKKGKFYYSLMGNRDKMRFKGNVDSQNICFETLMQKEYGCFECFLKDSFDWRLSMQGNHYWELVNQQIKSKNELRKKDLFVIWFLLCFLLLFSVYFYFFIKK